MGGEVECEEVSAGEPGGMMTLFMMLLTTQERESVHNVRALRCVALRCVRACGRACVRVCGGCVRACALLHATSLAQLQMGDGWNNIWNQSSVFLTASQTLQAF